MTPSRNDVVLVCSDGLSNKVQAADMQRIVVENFDSLEMACAVLVKEANENVGVYNITVVIGKLIGDDLPEPAGEDVQLEVIDLGNIHDTADQDTAETL